jgi:hypothetical protein
MLPSQAPIISPLPITEPLEIRGQAIVQPLTGRAQITLFDDHGEKRTGSGKLAAANPNG